MPALIIVVFKKSIDSISTSDNIFFPKVESKQSLRLWKFAGGCNTTLLRHPNAIMVTLTLRLPCGLIKASCSRIKENQNMRELQQLTSTLTRKATRNIKVTEISLPLRISILQWNLSINYLVLFLCILFAHEIYHSFSLSKLLRIYPWPFARALVDMLEDLKKSSCGTPKLPEVTPSAFTMFSSLWYRDDREWQYVNFAEVYNYLRGNRKLCIPPEWRGVIPSRLEWKR